MRGCLCRVLTPDAGHAQPAYAPCTSRLHDVADVCCRVHSFKDSNINLADTWHHSCNVAMSCAFCFAAVLQGCKVQKGQMASQAQMEHRGQQVGVGARGSTFCLLPYVAGTWCIHAPKLKIPFMPM